MDGGEGKNMKSKYKLGLAACLAFVLVSVITLNTKLQAEAESRELNKAVFYVA